MKKFVASCLLFVLTAVPAFADVLIPEFAFTGEDISKFSVAPSYMDVSLSFNVASGFDTYIRQESFRLENTQEKEYSSAEPGGMYSGSFGTSLSSVFVGERAYRNNIVKNFIRKEYIQVIESYGKYRQRLAGTPYIQECSLLYGLSLMETGNLSGGADALKTVIKSGGAAGDIATDSLFSYYFNTKNYPAVITAGREQPKFTEYSLYTYLYSLMQRKDYAQIEKTVAEQKELFDKFPYMYDFAVVADYLLGKPEEVAKLAGKATANTAPMIADTLLSRGDRAGAEKLINAMPEGEAKNVLNAKLAVLGRNVNRAAELTGKLKADENRLNVFFFYVRQMFPALDPAFGDRINFDKKINKDYINYYNGLAAMAGKDYPQAVRRLDSIIFSRELMESAYFYRGIAYFRTDISKTEFLLLKYIDSSEEDEKVKIARYVLGQIYYLRGRTADALMLVEDCFTDDCKLLKAEIAIGGQKYEAAEGLLGNLQGEKASKLRAAILYNKKDFKGALAELKKVPHTEKETDYLLMLTYLKLDQHDEAVKIYRKHFADMQFFDTLTESLFLAGDYRRVLDLLNSTDNEPKNLLLKAKVYTSMKRYDDAEPIYRTLIAKNYAIFDSVYGLLSGYAARNMKTEFLKTGEMSLTGLGRFERKDFLLIQAARLAIDLKEIDLATKMVNRFFGEFPDSQYVREGYLLRGRLFKNTGRLEQCIADADRLMAIGGSKEDALFLKADCTEAKDSAAAVKIYLQLTESERFRELANSKIAEVSRNPAEVLKSTEYFKDKDSELYYTGMDRYLSLLDGAELVKNEQTVKDMLVSKNVSVMPGAYFHQGRILEVKKQPEQAAAAYMKGYYLFPESKYAKQSLRKTVDIYKKLGKTSEAQVLEKKLSGK